MIRIIGNLVAATVLFFLSLYAMFLFCGGTFLVALWYQGDVSVAFWLQISYMALYLLCLWMYDRITGERIEAIRNKRD